MIFLNNFRSFKLELYYNQLDYNNTEFIILVLYNKLMSYLQNGHPFRITAYKIYMLS